MLCAWWLKSTDEGATESDVAVIRAMKRLYVPSLGWAFRHAWLVRAFALAITIPAFLGFRYVGTEFMPELDEGALLIQTVLPGEASLEQVDKANLQVQEAIEGVERRGCRVAAHRWF